MSLSQALSPMIKVSFFSKIEWAYDPANLFSVQFQFIHYSDRFWIPKLNHILPVNSKISSDPVNTNLAQESFGAKFQKYQYKTSLLVIPRAWVWTFHQQ